MEERRGDRSWLHPATDLSTDGLHVLVSDDRRAIDPEAVLDVEFTLPTGAAIRTHVRIAYTDDRHGQRGLGLQFVALDPEHRGAIDAFLRVTSHARARAR